MSFAGFRGWLFCCLSLLAPMVAFSAPTGKLPMGEMIIGEWSLSAYISPADFERANPAFALGGVEMESTIAGKMIIRQDGKYGETGKVVIRAKGGGGEVNLQFLVRETGSWEIRGDRVLQTTEAAEISPLDAATHEYLRRNPEAAAALRPEKGKITVMRVLSVSESNLVVELEEHKIQYLLRREGK